MLYNFNIIYVLYICFTLVFATLESEKNSNNVKVQFWNADLDKWNEQGITESVTSVITQAVNNACSTDPAQCSLFSNNTAKFVARDVEFMPGFPKQVGSSVVLTFSIDFPSHAEVSGLITSYFLPKSVLYDLMVQSRAKFKEVTSQFVNYVDATHFSPPVNKNLNSIMIAIGCVLLAIIIIVLIAFACWMKNIEKEEKKHASIKHKDGLTGFEHNDKNVAYAHSSIPPKGSSMWSVLTSGNTPRTLQSVPHTPSSTRHTEQPSQSTKRKHQDALQLVNTEEFTANKGAYNNAYDDVTDKQPYENE